MSDFQTAEQAELRAMPELERLSAFVAMMPRNEFGEHNRLAVEGAYMTVQNEIARMIAERPPEMHEGPHPMYGYLTTHKGRREECTGPDCDLPTLSPREAQTNE